MSYLYSVCVVVQKQDTRSSNFFCFYHCLQVCQQTHVFRHISCQNLFREYLGKDKLKEWLLLFYYRIHQMDSRILCNYEYMYKFCQKLILFIYSHVLFLKITTFIFVEKIRSFTEFVKLSDEFNRRLETAQITQRNIRALISNLPKTF